MEEAARRVQLPPRSEYRVELEANEALSVRFISEVPGNYGDAEVFGAPLIGGSQERWYTFGNEAKFALSSWGGAEVELVGAASTEYMADEPSPTYTYDTNLHLNFERARIRAREQLRSDKKLVQSLKDCDVSQNKEPPSYNDPEATFSSELYTAAGQGPRVMVVGSKCTGKTSLVKFLANYAMRSPALANIEEGTETTKKVHHELEEDIDDDDDDDRKEPSSVPADGEELSEITGWWPMIVALNPCEGAVPMPGCLSAIPLRPTPINCLPSPSPALPYGVTTQTTGALPPTVSTAESVMPLVHWLGKQNVSENERHTCRVIDHLAYQVEKRMVKDTRARMSGLLLDMPGVTTSDSRSRYSYIQYCIRAFKIDTVVVVGNEKLNLELTKLFSANASQNPVQVVKAVELDEIYRQKLHDLQIRTYFYGMQPPIPRDVGTNDDRDEEAPSREGYATLPCFAEPLGGVPVLNPYSTSIPLDLLTVYRVGQDRIAPSSALPIGAERVVSELQAVKLDPVESSSDASSLLHSVLALLDVPSEMEYNEDGLPTESSLLRASVIGFLHVSDIDLNRKKMTVLSPKAGRLPSKTALIGNLHWQDS